PHALTQEDEYKGMFIPKNSMVFSKLAGIMHAATMFPDPDNFCPERFLEVTDPRLQAFDLPFGWGRRICPGMYLFLNSFFISVSRILWAFDITPAVDVTGAKNLPNVWNYTSGFNSCPAGFDCTIAPRSDKVAELLNMECEGAKSWISDLQR
ncbi:cytochrome P450, partial [Suillus lakei]